MIIAVDHSELMLYRCGITQFGVVVWGGNILLLRRATAMFIGAATLGGVGLSATPAFASSTASSAALVTAAASKVDEANKLLNFDSKADGSVVSVGRPSAGSVDVSVDGATIALRSSALGGDFTSTSVNTDVAAGRNTDNVVQKIDNGVRVAQVLKDGSAPTDTAYTLNGATFAQYDNTVLAIKDGKAVGIVAPAWAVDANGKNLETSYSVVNGALVQHTNTAGAAFPVVADPSISFGVYVYIRYNKSDVHNAASVYNNSGAIIMAGIICAPAAETGWLYGACVTAAGAVGTSVGGQMKDASKANQCVEHRYIYPPVAALVGWRRYDC